MTYKDAISIDENGRPNADLSKISHIEFLKALPRNAAGKLPLGCGYPGKR